MAKKIDAPPLKPCPFCGGSNLTIGHVESNGEDAHIWGVDCADCDIGGPIKDTLEEASAAWNRRAIEPPWDDIAYVVNMRQAGRTQVVQHGAVIYVDMAPFLRVREWLEASAGARLDVSDTKGATWTGR